MTDTAPRSETAARLVRLVAVVVFGAVLAALPLRRLYGDEGLEALAAAALAALAVVLLPTLIVRESASNPLTVLKLTALRMGLFFAAVVAIYLGAAESVREPAAIAFAGLYVLTLAVETISQVQALPRRGVGPVENAK